MSSSEIVTVTHQKTCLKTANPFEQKFGYHRAVRRGPFIAISGTTALKLLDSSAAHASTEIPTDEIAADSESSVHFARDAYRQTVFVLDTCLAAVRRLGGRREDVVRVRMFVSNSQDCGTVGDAFKDTFGASSEREAQNSGLDEDMVGTAATMIVVPGGFVDGEILVEIEMEAFFM